MDILHLLAQEEQINQAVMVTLPHPLQLEVHTHHPLEVDTPLHLVLHKKVETGTLPQEIRKSHHTEIVRRILIQDLPREAIIHLDNQML